jgi:hypothetical protein
MDEGKKYCIGEDFRLVKKPVGTAENAELLFSSEILNNLKR